MSKQGCREIILKDPVVNANSKKNEKEKAVSRCTGNVSSGVFRKRSVIEKTLTVGDTDLGPLSGNQSESDCKYVNIED